MVEAFLARGQSDPYGSRDLEDIVSLLDGAPGMTDALRAADEQVRSYLVQWARGFVGDDRCEDLVAGHIARGPLSGERTARVLALLRQLARQ